ncbi:Speckle-type POZ protein like [Argiope bruennichi]|uniref:Speckle-type POZ protein like n=1 Tax=Argiope bruennichi TaxID=94029 RepID=A0A8T0F3T2_ARGBR|nr:Speckle-type POZ protein like [Argiope bruennichi]
MSKVLFEFFYTWRLENVHLCWEKTDEFLRSPAFEVEWLQKSSVSLRLYPKGMAGKEDYISYYAAIENKQTAPNKGFRANLYLLAADGSKIQAEIPEGFLSMKKSGLYGYSQFISWQTLWDKESNYFPNSTLTLCCRIWSEREADVKGKKKSTERKAFIRTCIRKEVISKLMVIDSIALIGEIRSLTQDHPIATFSASFDKSHKNLIIDIDAKQNDKILMSMFKLTLIDEKRKRIFWKKYLWNNASNLETIKLSSHFSQNTEQYVPHEMFAEKFLFLDCRFDFTTGCVMQKQEKDDYGSNLNLWLPQPFPSSEETSQCPNIADALLNMYLDETSHDICIETSTSSITAHEMVLCSRSEKFKSLMKIKDVKTSLKTVIVEEDIDTMKRLIYFLYTDVIQETNWKILMNLYNAAMKYEIDLLKHKCRNLIKTKLEISNVVEILILAKKYKDVELNALARNFIMENDAAVFNTTEWKSFMKSDPNFAVQTMLSKYHLK